MNRFAAVVVLLAIAACSQSDQPAGGAGKLASDAIGAQPAMARAPFTETRARRIRQAGTFASLADRGELLAYPDRDESRRDGAYTWHRAGVSEAYALRAIVERKLRVVTPSGDVLDIEYDHHIEHDSGDWSWVGHLPGDPGAQTILTFGAEAVFGSIAQTGKRSLRLTSRDGAAWLVETDPSKLAGIASAGANPTKPDHLAVPKQLLDGKTRTSAAQRQAAPSTIVAAAPTTIDVLVGYTGGIASRPGGASAALTRINNLVTVTNEAYANSQVNARVRLVHAMQVNYTETTTNESTLEQLTGYDVSEQDFTTPNAAFNALRAAREQYGADLVVLMRAFRDPEQDGCGIAWLIGGGKSASTVAGQDYFGYSVVGDGQDRNEQDGKTYFCRDESFAHELGHNMGSAHDRAEAMGDDGVLNDPDDYGAFAYSFGYKTGATAGNFYTIMAYGDEGQQDYRVFSNPRITTCGGRACGTANDDNARSLGAITPLVAGFRGAIVPTSTIRTDVNGDSRSDLLWANAGAHQFAYWLMSGSTLLQSSVSSVSAGYRIAATGDFNGDARTDVVWTSNARDLYLWLGASGSSSRRLPNYASGWALQGAADVNGDGVSDLLWTNSATRQFAYWIMNGASIVRTATYTISSGYRIGAVGDFNGDGFADVVWTSSARDLYVWLGNGAGFVSRPSSGYASGWTLRGAGDVNADGRSDLLWTNPQASRFAYWLMDGPTIRSASMIAISAGYSIGTIGDFNGDGRVDLVWTSSARDLYLWTGTATGFTSRRLSSYASGWSLIDTKSTR